MVFRAKNGKTFKVRVDHPIDGDHAVLSTGCRIREDADDVEAIVHLWQGRKGKKHERLEVLRALIDKRFELKTAIEAHYEGTLDALLTEAPAADTSIDLLAGDPSLVDQWVKRKQKSGKGAGQAETYKKQVLTLFPERPLRLSLLTRKEVWSRLHALDVDAPTKNRYRTAVSSLVKDLVAQELLETNFVRDIEGFGENDPRLVYFDDIADAKKLIAKLPAQNAALAAMALGFCMEWGALEEARAGDVALKADPITCHVRGTKTDTRDRVVPLVPELAWVMKYIRPILKGKLPGAKLFDGLTNWDALDIQRAAAEELKIVAVGEDEFGAHSIHDWRQTHTVALLRWNYSEQIAADHLGHANTTLVRKNYGRFKTTKFDYAKTSATSKGEKHG
jgi:integrase